MTKVLSVDEKAVAERTARNFWRHVDKSGECWIWTGAVDKAGYGRFGMNHTSHTANRIAWMLTHGDPGKLFVCHKCDNTLCVRPSHMFLGTPKDNQHDKIFKKGYIVNKLSMTQVKLAHQLRKDGLKIRQIAEKFGVKWSVVQNALLGNTYKLLGNTERTTFGPHTPWKYCKRGHLMAKTRETNKWGQSYCGVCRRAYIAKAH